MTTTATQRHQETLAIAGKGGLVRVRMQVIVVQGVGDGAPAAPPSPHPPTRSRSTSVEMCDAQENVRQSGWPGAESDTAGPLPHIINS